MKMSYNALFNALRRNVLEIQFTRRHEKTGWSEQRRGLFTNCSELLNSVGGKTALMFKTPTHSPPYNARSYNLIITWDIFQADFRAFGVESADVITIIPAFSKPEQDRFWQYYAKYLQTMSRGSKFDFMNP